MPLHKQKVPLKNLPIRLGQFLKLIEVVQDGLEAKILIAGGKILVNDRIETRRGRQLQASDEVRYGATTWIVAQEL